MRHTDATKQKLSEMRRGDRNPFYGRTHSPEVRAMLAERASRQNAARQYEAAPQLIRAPEGVSAAYLAGMIDADGSVRFKKGRPFVSIYNTHRPLMGWLMETLGHGSLSSGNVGRERVIAWTIQGARDVHALLCAVRPFLIVKAADADAALAHLRGKYEWAN